jgi:hypothetical protein
VSVWAAGIAEATAKGFYLHVGIGVSDVRALLAAGVDVRAAVSVSPEAAPPARGCPVPLLSFTAPTRSGVDLQAGHFGLLLEEKASVIASFFDDHDPDGEATVVGAQSAPLEASGGRAQWLPDSRLARALELKGPSGSLLGDLVPWIEAEAGPASANGRWWREATARLRADRLVVQRVGLSAAGEGTWVCASVTEVQVAMERCGGPTRVSPWLQGASVNVTALISLEGAVVVLPPSRQLVLPDGEGRPLYFGNTFDGVVGAQNDRLVSDARMVGVELASRGYVGPFGLDAILTAEGPRYHDLNARVNGAMYAHSLELPIIVGGLLFPGWCTSERRAAAEAEVRSAVERNPIARWLLTVPAVAGQPVPHPPVGGFYRLDAALRTAQRIGAVGDRAAVRDDVVFVEPRSPRVVHRAGERREVANVWCSAELAATLLDRHGDTAARRMVGALEGASG